MHTLRQTSQRLICLSWLSVLLFLSACAVQLAPTYDKEIVSTLANSNIDAMTMFATVANGTSAQDFSSRADKYAGLIGKLDALAIQAGARPQPKNKVTDAINNILVQRGMAAVGEDANMPSVTAVKKISETVSKMRDVDQKQGLRALEVKAFKGQATLYFEQAITYENFLQR